MQRELSTPNSMSNYRSLRSFPWRPSARIIPTLGVTPLLRRQPITPTAAAQVRGGRARLAEVRQNRQRKSQKTSRFTIACVKAAAYAELRVSFNPLNPLGIL